MQTLKNLKSYEKCTCNCHEKPNLLGHNIDSHTTSKIERAIATELGSKLPSEAGGIHSLDSRVLTISMTKWYFTSDLLSLSMALLM